MQLNTRLKLNHLLWSFSVFLESVVGQWVCFLCLRLWMFFAVYYESYLAVCLSQFTHQKVHKNTDLVFILVFCKSWVTTSKRTYCLGVLLCFLFMTIFMITNSDDRGFIRQAIDNNSVWYSTEGSTVLDAA